MLMGTVTKLETIEIAPFCLPNSATSALGACHATQLPRVIASWHYDAHQLCQYSVPIFSPFGLSLDSDSCG